MLKMRLIGVNDYTVHEDGQLIGRIRYASERTPGKWLWNVTVTIPGPPFGDATTIDQAKERFKEAWMAFKHKHGPDMRRWRRPIWRWTTPIDRVDIGSDPTKEK